MNQPLHIVMTPTRGEAQVIRIRIRIKTTTHNEWLLKNDI